MNRRQQFPLGAAVTLAELEGNPHPLLHRLRAAEPVSWLPALDAWLVTHHPDALGRFCQTRFARNRRNRLADFGWVRSKTAGETLPAWLSC